jgi:hypothetical protein
VRQLQAKSQEAVKNPKTSSPALMTEAHQRFYTLLEKVYLLKLQNGELDQTNYGNVMSAVDDIMAPITINMPEDHINTI